MLEKIKKKVNNMSTEEMTALFYGASLTISALYVVGYLIRAIKK
jgi:hypothetical protein